MKKIISLFCISALLLSLFSCSMFLKNTESIDLSSDDYPDLDGNPYTTHIPMGDDVYCRYDYSEVYETLDLSEYTNRGDFGEDGIMWVEKSDYTGKLYGYIDYRGNVIVPLTEEIVSPGNFDNGLAIVAYENDPFGNGRNGIIDTNGNVVGEFRKTAISKINHLSNGNILLDAIDIYDNEEGGTYMFCKNSGHFAPLPIPAWQSANSVDFSDGLLLIYSNHREEVVAYFDENGNCVIDLENDDKYYGSIRYAERFENGQATVTFGGKDQNLYTVVIDKTGNWITEPEYISEYDANWFANGY